MLLQQAEAFARQQGATVLKIGVLTRIGPRVFFNHRLSFDHRVAVLVV
jgi:hypothetical protein